MAYNRKNKLRLIIDIQEIYVKNSRKHGGAMTDVDIYNHLVKPVYHISRDCFYRYLAANAKKELSKIKENETRQISINFGE